MLFMNLEDSKITEPLTIDEFIDYAVSLGCDRALAAETVEWIEFDVPGRLGKIADLLEQVAKAKEKRG